MTLASFVGIYGGNNMIKNLSAGLVAAAVASLVAYSNPVTAEPAQVTADDSQGADQSRQLRRGKLLFLQCRACHSLVEEEGHLVGPNLDGLFGRVAGSGDGFIYSETFASSDLEWSTESLDQFLLRPNDLFPGTKMAFAGIADAEDRQLLIAYIEAKLGE